MKNVNKWSLDDVKAIVNHVSELDEKVLSGEISPSMARAELDALFDFVQMDANIQKEKTLVAKSKLKKRGSL